jgi:hypothetical protein
MPDNTKTSLSARQPADRAESVTANLGPRMTMPWQGTK